MMLGTRLTLMAAPLLCMAMFGTAHAADLVVSGFGGLWQQGLQQCVIAPFEKETGKKVDLVLGTPAQWLNQISANKAKPPIDVVFLPTDNAIDAKERGLTEANDLAKVPNFKDIPERFTQPVDGQGAVFDYGALGLVYNKQTVKNPPKTWKEFVEDVVAGKFKASMPGINYFGGGVDALWMYSMLYGGGIDNVQPGLAQIKRMLDSGNLQLWNDPNQVLNSLKSGDVDAAMYWDGRAWGFIKTGNPEFDYTTPKPGAVGAYTFIQKVKNGSPLAWQFLNVAMAPGPQQCFATVLRYGVSNSKVVYPDSVKSQITDISVLLNPDFKAFPAHESAWVEQWNKQIGR